MSLFVHNSISDQLEAFSSLHPGKVSLYVCGPTVYSESHLGHAKTYVGFDVILRYLRYKGYETFYVQNITDVGHLVGDGDEGEDKLIKKAKEAKKEPMAIAEYYARYHSKMMDQLAVIPPDISPRASGHIGEQLEAIRALIEKGFAYEANGSVYFEVSKASDYGVLSNRTTEELVEGARIEVRSEKRSPHDFALWKRADTGHLMQWKDPWSGAGYPGWHIECSVMSTKYLGDSFDIHGGGMELKFPHHECEIAQAHALGKPFSRYWLHSNMLTIEGQKMSKSTGNFVTLSDALSQWPPSVIRYFIVSAHYRSVLDYSDRSLESAQTGWQRLYDVVQHLKREVPIEALPSGLHFQEHRRRFEEAMDHDFSTPQALAVLFELTREVNSYLHEETSPALDVLTDALFLFKSLAGDILGILPENDVETAEASSVGDIVSILIDLRNQARHQKDYATSDQIRKALQQAHIELKDDSQSTTWRWISRHKLS